MLEFKGQYHFSISRGEVIRQLDTVLPLSLMLVSYFT